MPAYPYPRNEYEAVNANSCSYVNVYVWPTCPQCGQPMPKCPSCGQPRPQDYGWSYPYWVPPSYPNYVYCDNTWIDHIASYGGTDDE